MMNLFEETINIFSFSISSQRQDGESSENLFSWETGREVQVISMQERRNSSALALEIRLSCTNPSIYKLATPQVLFHTGNSAIRMDSKRVRTIT